MCFVLTVVAFRPTGLGGVSPSRVMQMWFLHGPTQGCRSVPLSMLTGSISAL